MNATELLTLQRELLQVQAKLAEAQKMLATVMAQATQLAEDKPLCACCDTILDEDSYGHCFICNGNLCNDCRINMAGTSEHVVLDCCYKCEDKPHPKNDLCACTACN